MRVFVAARLGRVVDELDGAGVLVADAAGEADRGFADLPAQCGGEHRRGRFLDELLVATLRAAIALAEVDVVAVTVTEDLDLDVVDPREVAFHVDARIGERRRGFGPGLGEPLFQLGRGAHHPHAPAATARARLEQQRIADVGGLVPRRVHVGNARIRSGHHGDMVRGRRGAAGDLVPHQLDGLRRRSDEREPVLCAAPREGRVLRHEPVARMDGIASGAERGGEQGIRQQVAPRRRRRPDAHRAIRLGEVRRVPVGSRMHRDRFETRGPAGTQDPRRDLAAVGDEHPVHGSSRLKAWDGGGVADGARPRACRTSRWG